MLTRFRRIWENSLLMKGKHSKIGDIESFVEHFSKYSRIKLAELGIDEENICKQGFTDMPSEDRMLHQCGEKNGLIHVVENT